MHQPEPATLIPHVMGCTSSSPNNPLPPSPYANATVKDLEDIIEEKIQMKNIDEVKTNVKMELPSCDTLVEQVATVARDSEASMVASDKNEPSMIIDDPVEDLPKETHNVGLVQMKIENNPEPEPISRIESEDKLSRLEEIVEKVVEILSVKDMALVSQNGHKTTEVVKPSNDDKAEDEIPSELQATGEAEEEIEENESDEEEDEPASPSQSASSRATRWEALADIAAELPPSLTVDPLTGQIYALSK